MQCVGLNFGGSPCGASVGHWSLVVVTQPPIHERKRVPLVLGGQAQVWRHPCVAVVGKLGHSLGPTVSLPQGVHVEGWKPPDMVRHPQSVGLWASHGQRQRGWEQSGGICEGESADGHWPAA